MGFFLSQSSLIDWFVRQAESDLTDMTEEHKVLRANISALKKELLQEVWGGILGFFKKTCIFSPVISVVLIISPLSSRFKTAKNEDLSLEMMNLINARVVLIKEKDALAAKFAQLLARHSGDRADPLPGAAGADTWGASMRASQVLCVVFCENICVRKMCVNEFVFLFVNTFVSCYVTVCGCFRI